MVMDINLTDELIDEGFVREIMSKLQMMRKEAGFEVLDRIEVSYSGSDKIAGIFERFGDEISKDVLADKTAPDDIKGYSKEWNINGETALLSVYKL